MQLLSVAVALVALGFTFSLSRSRRGDDRYGIVLIVLPLALATPLVALMASGLQLIYGYRGAVSSEGLEALTRAVERAVDIQYVGHLTVLAVLGVLTVIAVALLVAQPAPGVARGKPNESDHESNDESEDGDDERSESKPLSKLATPMMVASVVVCVVAMATLGELEDRFLAAPIAFVVAFDADDVSEFATNRRAVEAQQRQGSNALVIETFRTLVVVMLFLVLFDAFLVGSRSATFTRTTLFVSIALVALAAAVSYRAVSRADAFRRNTHERLSAAALARAESRRASEDVEAEPETDESSIPE